MYIQCNYTYVSLNTIGLLQHVVLLYECLCVFAMHILYMPADSSSLHIYVYFTVLNVYITTIMIYLMKSIT